MLIPGGFSMQNDQKTQAPSPMSVTEMGNPGNPAGLAGQDMLLQMNQSNFAVTGWALSFFDYEDTDSVLDIGCGGGVTLQRLSARLPEGHLTGVDHSPVAVAVSRKTNLRDITMGRAEIVEASVAALPFPDSSFDKIITVESFYFWPDPAENLKEVFRVLKPGGTFLLAADIYDTPALNERQKDNVRKYKLFNPTLEQYKTLLEDAGFTADIHTKEGSVWVCAEGKRLV